ncbi:MAG: hypothetical protein JRN54_07925 [Nitrososphaerota archaeon]|jgi:hypothetical protein|nr:hypothetical protein [Nitrososphaerota archaeon]
MNAGRPITAKYLADVAGLNPEMVRKYARQLREMAVASSSFEGESEHK